MEGQFSGCGNGQETQVSTETDFQMDLETTPMQFYESNVQSEHIGDENLNTPSHAEVEEINGDQFASGSGNKKGLSHRGKAFLPQEDRAIVSAWLNISTDAATGASQTSNAFYARLYQNFLHNYPAGTNRTQLSIQNRWVTIRRTVSKFCATHSAIVRRNESGKTDQDKVTDAIRLYEQNKPWQFGHCWMILHNEPKWNHYLVECSKSKQCKERQPNAAMQMQTPTTRAQIERPEGRDSVKKRKSAVEDSSSSVAVEMLEKIHSRGQQMDELEAKQKDELIAIERAKFDLQQRALLAKIEQGDKKIELQREVSREQIQLKREIMETNRFQTEVQIMFTDLNSVTPSVRFWIAKKQRDILMKEGINPDAVQSTSAGTSNDRPAEDP